MRTKTVYYYVDLSPNWHKTDPSCNPESPWLSHYPQPCNPCEGYKRIKIAVELPIFGDEGEEILTTSTELKNKGFKELD